MEVVKRHMMAISSEDEEVVSDNYSCMSVSCWGPLTGCLSQSLVIATWGVSASLPVDSSFPDLSIAFLETWISILDKERILHCDRSWRFKLNYSVIYLVGTDRS